MYIPNGFTTVPNSDLFRVEFSDNSPTLYAPSEIISKVEIIGRSIFNKMIEASTRCFHCYQCSADIFTAMFGIVVENKNVNEVLHTDLRRNPWVFEILQSNLSFFYPSREFSNSLLRNFSNMSIEDAKAMSAESNDLSFALVLAHKRLRDSIYFTSEDEAMKYSEKLDRCIKSYNKAKLLDLNNEERKKHIEPFKNDLKDAYEELKKLKKSPLGQLNATRHINHENPYVRAAAQKAVMNLKNYCESILDTLNLCGADLTRQDLLEHIIGPKNFLFSHYGIVPLYRTFDEEKKEKHRESPFRFVPVLQGTCANEKQPHLAPLNPLGFKLNNDTPENLEIVIRTKIQEKREGPFSNISFNHQIPSKLFPTNSNIPFPENFKMMEYLNSCLKDMKPLENEFLNQEFQKKLIYFSNKEEAQKWFENNPSIQTFKKRKLSLWSQKYASEYLEDENPFIQLKALKAKKVIKVYINSILSTLKICNSQLYRKDLLEHIIGPKNFLFSYYGIVPLNNPDNPDYPFGIIPGAMNTFEFRQKLHLAFCKLGYALENLGPKGLEEEIRSDIEATMNNTTRTIFETMPAPLIQSDEISYPITPELQSLQDKLLPKISHWDSLSQEERNAFVALILKFNEWDKYKIQLEDIKIFLKSKKKDNFHKNDFVHFFEGSLKIGSEKYPFHFNTYDFLLVIEEGHVNPDTRSTHKFLERKFKNPSENHQIIIGL